MQKFLAGLLPKLSVDVAHDEIPVSEIDGPAARVTARGAAGAKASGGAKACEDRRRPKQDFESKRPIVESKQGQGLTVRAGCAPTRDFAARWPRRSGPRVLACRSFVASRTLPN